MAWGWTVWILLAGCFGTRTTEARDANAPSSVAATAEAEEGVVTAEGLVIDLYDADPAAAGAEVLPRPAARTLDPRATAAILGRAPEITSEVSDEAPFALRTGPKPPPLPGSDVTEPFPPSSSAARPAIAAGALHVARHQPDGPVPLAPHVSITFDQPMVAIGAVSAPRQVPARLAPAAPGRWRWLGTQTLVFEPDGERMPMATEYTVEIPAETKSAAGTALGEAMRFSFSTPPPVLQSVWPSDGPVGLEPVILLAFDQRVDAKAVLSRAALRGGPEVRLRLATEAEVAADEAARHAVANLQADRIVALRAVAPLKPATSYNLALAAGTPSAEGPRVTTSEQNGSFYTYPPLTVTGAHCWHQDPCPPSAPLIVELSNPLADDNDLSTVTVEPKVPGLSVTSYSNTIHVTGALAGRTAYTVTLPASLRDIFGQTLGAPDQRVFRVGPAEKSLYSPGDAMVVLDPVARGKLSVFTVNHEALTVVVHRVTVADWERWLTWNEGQWDGTGKKPLPGTQVARTTVKPTSRPDQLVETAIDLSPYLADGLGQFVVHIEPTKQPKERWRRQMIAKWVQVTNIGLVAFVDGRKLVGWASALADGAPLPDTALSLLSGSKAATGADGLASLELPTVSREFPNVLVARRGSDVALLPESFYRWGGNAWQRITDLANLRWYVIDDRGLYKPGETAKVKGWLRLSDPGPMGDLRKLAPLGRIRYRLYDAVGNEIRTGEVPVTGLGGFSLSLDLPADMNTGDAALHLEAVEVGSVSGTSASHALKVAEFRRPEFEVRAASDADAHVLGDRAQIDLDATYYAGGGLANADVTWTVYAKPTSYQPPGWAAFTFGTWTPWWRVWNAPDEQRVGEHQARTDGQGAHHLGMFFRSVNPAKPMLVRAEGTVMDVNRQAWTATDTVLLHPSAQYVGLRAGAAFVEKGKPVDVEVVLVDIDGKPVAGEAEVTFARQDGRWTRGRWVESEVDRATCSVRAGSDGKGRCSFPTVRGGQYLVKAGTTDAQSRPNESELRVWVSGAELAPARQIELEEVTLVPEKKDVAVGETARILVQAPFYPAHAVMTVRRDGLLSTERFTMDGPTRTVSVPIAAGMVPDITVQVDLVGQAPRVGDDGEALAGVAPRPAHASGALTIPISPIARALQVKLTPAEATLAPGAETSITVEVATADGAPLAGAEVALIVADESVLALTGYRLPDPLEVFYAARGANVQDLRSRAMMALADPLAATTASSGGGPRDELQQLGYLSVEADGAGGGGPRPARRMRAMAAPMASAPAEMVVDSKASKPMASPDIAVRADFSALALFAPDVSTDKRGRAVVALKLPDSLTRYRVMAVAVDPDRSFGSAESAVTARLPLMVRPSAPRFLNTGDQFELPVVVQNQTDRAMTVDVAVRATNLKWIDKVSPTLPALAPVSLASAGKRVTVPANDRVEVRFPAAASMAGTARIQAVAVSGKSADAAELSLPVWTPATTEAFATYGTIDGPGVVLPVQAPSEAWPTFGALTVTTSSTQLQALTDAVIYLQRYPFECSEQIASRLLGIASLRDVLTAFEADGLPPKDQLEAQVRKDIDRLAQLQHGDGGFSFWRKDDESWPYLSIHVANALARAEAKGFEIPSRTRSRSLDHLRDIESHIPHFYSPASRWFLRAYALDVRRRMGDADLKEARALLAEAGDGLGLDGIAFLLPTLHEEQATAEVDAILRRLGNQTNETAGAAHFVTSYTDGAQLLLHSDRRADGIILEALLETRPQSDLIPKVVRGLLAHQTKGRWANTQENAFILLALDRYFAVYEKETPDFVARVWLGDGYAGEHTFRGRTTERSHVAIPMETLTERPGTQRLTLGRDGKGRMYYRAGLTYAPKDLTLSPLDQGFVVERRYEAIDDPKDVRRDPNGTWHVRAGARVKVALSLVAEARRYHVALIDPLPAGLEALNPALATTGTLPQQVDPGSDPWWFWSRTWYEHENMRDERVEVFASLLWEGVHEYSYIARATTPGRFVVPPPKVEEMYMPETFGRGGSDTLVVDP